MSAGFLRFRETMHFPSKFGDGAIRSTKKPPTHNADGWKLFDNLNYAAWRRLRRQPQPTRAMTPMTRPPEPTPPGMLEFLVWESQIRRQEMPRKRYTPEQIIQHLREAEVLLAQE